MGFASTGEPSRDERVGERIVSVCRIGLEGPEKSLMQRGLADTVLIPFFREPNRIGEQRNERTETSITGVVDLLCQRAVV